jgi:hypothetical protein
LGDLPVLFILHLTTLHDAVATERAFRFSHEKKRPDDSGEQQPGLFLTPISLRTTGCCCTDSRTDFVLPTSGKAQRSRENFFLNTPVLFTAPTLRHNNETLSR